MVTFSAFLFLGILLFMINGLARGWYRELLGTFGIILGLNLLQFIEHLYRLDVVLSPKNLFLFRSVVLGVSLFLGYQVPSIRDYRRGPKGFSASLLGGFWAAVNGYLFIGLLWYFLEAAHYPWPTFVKPPIDPFSIKIAHYLPSVLFQSSLALRGSLLLAFLIVITVII